MQHGADSVHKPSIAVAGPALQQPALGMKALPGSLALHVALVLGRAARRGTVQASIELDVSPAAQSAHPASRRPRRDRIHLGTTVGSITIKHHGKAAAVQGPDRTIGDPRKRPRQERIPALPDRMPLSRIFNSSGLGATSYAKLTSMYSVSIN